MKTPTEIIIEVISKELGISRKKVIEMMKNESTLGQPDIFPLVGKALEIQKEAWEQREAEIMKIIDDWWFERDDVHLDDVNKLKNQINKSGG